MPTTNARNYLHMTRDVSIALVSGPMLALAFAPGVMRSAIVDTPEYFVGIMVVGLLLAIVAVVLVQRLLSKRWRLSKRGLIWTTIGFAILITGIPAATALLVGPISEN